MSTVTRKIKNVVKQYTFAEIQVREATSNDNWGPTPRQLDQLTSLSHHNVAVVEMLGIIWRRLSERNGKSWRHVYKSLLVLDHLIKCGNEKVVQQSMEKLDLLKSLSSYDLHEEGRDVGAMIRDKSKQVASLLGDRDRLKNERTKMQNSKRNCEEKGLGSPIFHKDTLSSKKTGGRGSLPVSPVQFGSSCQNDADYQLQLALKMSIEEHEEQERKRKLEELRLHTALEESRRVPDSDGEAPPPSAPDPMDSRKEPVGKRLTLLSIATEHSSKTESPAETDGFDPIARSTGNEPFDPWGELEAVFSSNVAPSIRDPWSATDSGLGADFGNVAPRSENLDWPVDHYRAMHESKLNNNGIHKAEATFFTTQTTSGPQCSQAMFSPTNPFYATLTQQLVSMTTDSQGSPGPRRPVAGSDSSPWERCSASAHASHLPTFPSTQNGEGPTHPISSEGKTAFLFAATGLPISRQQTNPFL